MGGLVKRQIGRWVGRREGVGFSREASHSGELFKTSATNATQMQCTTSKAGSDAIEQNVPLDPPE